MWLHIQLSSKITGMRWSTHTNIKLGLQNWLCITIKRFMSINHNGFSGAQGQNTIAPSWNTWFGKCWMNGDINQLSYRRSTQPNTANKTYLKRRRLRWRIIRWGWLVCRLIWLWIKLRVFNFTLHQKFKEKSMSITCHQTEPFYILS